MAGNESATDIASLTQQSSPSDILDDIKIRRPLVKIPHGQRELLSRHETWASFLSRRPNGFVNVPPDVLDQLKALHTWRKHETGPSGLSRPGGHAGNDIEAPEQPGSQPLTPPHIEPDDEGGVSGDDGDPSEQMSWALSPEANLRPPAKFSSQEGFQPFITQCPENSPPPAVMTSPADHSRMPEFPQSSQGLEEELEVQVPAALPYNPEPVNKSALLAQGTPPSAQVVPCTFVQPAPNAPISVSGQPHPQVKHHSNKHIYNRLPELYRGPKQGVPSSYLKSNINPTNVEPALSLSLNPEDSVFTDNTSSPIIPSTRHKQDAGNENPTTDWPVRPGQIVTGDANFIIGDYLSPSISGRHLPVHMLTPLNHVPRPPQPPASATHIASSAATSRSWGAPFVHYTVTYPGYNGTIQDFVTACIYIKLQYRRIRTSLYDDFIRAWVEGYLPYVNDCDEAQPPRKPLRAIEWYNEIDDDPLFTSRVVTRQNLESILSFYPDEVEIARPSLAIPPNHVVSPQLSTSQHSKKTQPPETSPGMENSAAESHISEAKSSPFIADQQTKSRKFSSGIAVRSGQHKNPVRTFSDSTVHTKRIATNYPRSEPINQISLGHTPDIPSEPQSDTSNTVSSRPGLPNGPPQSSIIPELSMRKNSARAAEDPEEKRRRRLVKHFKRRLAGRESITSSISSSAPTSKTSTAR